jgi:hypothetical protein
MGSGADLGILMGHVAVFTFYDRVSLYSTDWPGTRHPSCFCLLSAEIIGMATISGFHVTVPLEPACPGPYKVLSSIPGSTHSVPGATQLGQPYLSPDTAKGPLEADSFLIESPWPSY